MVHIHDARSPSSACTFFRRPEGQSANQKTTTAGVSFLYLQPGRFTTSVKVCVATARWGQLRVIKPLKILLRVFHSTSNCSHILSWLFYHRASNEIILNTRTHWSAGFVSASSSVKVPLNPARAAAQPGSWIPLKTAHRSETVISEKMGFSN